jgi:hypothetical protein
MQHFLAAVDSFCHLDEEIFVSNTKGDCIIPEQIEDFLMNMTQKPLMLRGRYVLAML